MVPPDCFLWVRSLILERIWTLVRGSYARSREHLPRINAKWQSDSVQYVANWKIYYEIPKWQSYGYGIIDIRLCTWSDGENRTYRLSAVANCVCLVLRDGDSYRSPTKKTIIQQKWEIIAASWSAPYIPTRPHYSRYSAASVHTHIPSGRILPQEPFREI